MPESSKIVKWRCPSCQRLNHTSLLGDDSRRYCKHCEEVAFVRPCSICGRTFARRVDVLSICAKQKCHTAYRKSRGMTKDEFMATYRSIYAKKYGRKFRTATHKDGPVPYQGQSLSGSDLQHAKGDHFLRYLGDIVTGKTPYVGFN